MNIGTLIGVILGVLLYNIVSYYFSYDVVENRWMKRLSPDKKPEYTHGGYLLYANGTRWFLRKHVTFELYWIPISDGDDITQLILKDWNREYKCTWLPRETMYNDILRIIYTHPNLEPKSFYWRIRKFLDI